MEEANASKGEALHATAGAEIEEPTARRASVPFALARALVTAPQVLFLDEPCANLDGHATQEIEAILHAACADGTRIVMSTHDLGQARRLADEVLFVHAGQVVEILPAAAFFAGPASAQAAAFLNGDLVL